MLFDGLNVLILPSQLTGIVHPGNQASVLGLLTFLGLLAGMLVQPFAGTISDRLRPSLGRQGFIGVGVLLVLIALLIFAGISSLLGVILGYLAIQVTSSIVQAGQQGLIPDHVPAAQRGSASGLKGFMDMGGAMLGFILLGQLLGSGNNVLALGLIGFSLLLVYLLASILVADDPNRVRVDSEHIIAERISLKRSFSLDFRQHAAFVWLVASRFLFLLATYIVGRFMLFFVAERLSLSSDQAAEQAGSLLAGLALITVLASPLVGWAADRFGHIPLMTAGALLSASGVLLLIKASNAGQILLFGALMSLGSAAFASASWAMTADLVPAAEAARFFGLANFSTVGAAAAAGLFGPLVDWSNQIYPGRGYPLLFILAALIFISSVLVLKRSMRRSNRAVSEDSEIQDGYPFFSSASVEQAELCKGDER
jgi:MFS family permease